MKRSWEDTLDSDDDDLFNQVMDDFEGTQKGGGSRQPLFAFTLASIGPRRRWKNVVERTQFRADLRQLREPVTGDDIGLALTEALHTAIGRELRREVRHPNDFVNFSITAHGFTHAYQSINFQVGEFLARSVRLNELLQQLAGKLNSNESFDYQQGFQVDVVYVKRPRPGSGKGKKRNVGRKCMDNENKKKRCIIAIQNDDDLCCGRAIVTMREHCNKDDSNDAFHNFHNMRRGRVIQEHAAIELHRLAGVDRGPCGLEELEKFQQYLQPTYQLLVMCRTKPFFLIFRGRPAPKQIKLIKSHTHYDGCTSFPAFVNKSYWCTLCEKGFDHDDAKHHPCEGRSCHSCNRKDCPDYDRTNRNPPIICNFCHCRFYGNNCFDYHRQKNLCQKHRTCLKCHGEYNVVKGKRHTCGFAACPSCKEMVDIHIHNAYSMLTSRPCSYPTGSLSLTCFVIHESVNIVTHKGKDFVNTFLHDLDDATEIPDDDRERTIITIFHNLKEYDGMSIIDEMYQQQRSIENQLTVGSKVLSFESGPLIFKDSLCFLPMPLTSFPAAFNPTELKKGFFPHEFNLPQHQSYVGQIPALEFFDPDGMSENKKKELEEWHAEQVRRGLQYDFVKEMEEYCKSDMALLQAGCEASTKEFERHADFNPFAKCVTIASACNLYWRKHCLQENTIAVEPLKGWRGANVNQSVKALQWLYFKEQGRAKPDASPDRIRHVRNGGEQSVTCVEGRYFVNGYDPQSNTVYEFHGCFWHGCSRCHPGNRQTVKKGESNLQPWDVGKREARTNVHTMC